MYNLIKSLYKQASNQQIILLFSLISIFISWRLFYIQHGWVNNDFVLYFEAARLYAGGEWSQGFAVFGWPFYSLLIAVLHKLTGFDLHMSAQLLSVALFTIASYSFLNLINLAGGNKLTISCGALILFSSNYIVGDILTMLLRDPGFWAFYLTSLNFFVNFYRNQRINDALFWQVSAILATLFRIEGITFLILLPFVLITHPSTSSKERFGLVAKAQSINIALMMLLVTAILIVPSLSIYDFGRLQEIWTLVDYRHQQIIQAFLERSSLMAEQVLRGNFDQYAVFGLISAFAGMTLVKCASALGWVNLGLVWLNFKSKSKSIAPDTKRILFFVMALAMLNIIVILLRVLLLSGRYIIPLAFILMVFASFGLASLAHYWNTNNKKDSNKKWVFIFIVAFMSLSFFKNILPKQEGHNYQQDAVMWLKENNKSNKPVFYNDSRVRYYAGAPFVGTWGDNWLIVTSAIEDNTINHYDFLVISYSSEHPERERILADKLKQFREVKRFSPYKATKSLVIYQKKTE